MALVPIKSFFAPITRPIDRYFAGKTPSEILLTAFVAERTLKLMHHILFKTDWKRLIAWCVLQVPSVANEIHQELTKYVSDFEEELFNEEEEICQTLPQYGKTEVQINKMTPKGHEEAWNKGQHTGAFYHNRPDIKKVIVNAIEKHISTNAMHADANPHVRKEEASIISMVRELYHGDEQACGHMTSGGTESILLACLAARERGKDLYGITAPEIIVPTSIHTSFNKAEFYFGIKLVPIPIDPVTKKADVKQMKAAINSNTVLVAASFPTYPHGVFDPIQELSDVVGEYKGRIGLHVDCCLGGFLVPFMEGLPPYDFRLRWVTSTSVDDHKYGYAPKGSSVILYRNQEWLKYQFYCNATWPGGIYGSGTLSGSRPGYISAAAWAVMLHMGRDGYTKATKSIVDLTKTLIGKIKEIEDLEIMGDPQASVVSFRSKNKSLDIYELKEKLKLKGWHLAGLQYPPGLHFCLTLVHVDQKDFIERFIKDLKECITEIKSNPNPKKGRSIYGTMHAIPERFSWLTDYIFARFVKAYFAILVQHKPRVWRKITVETSTV